MNLALFDFDGTITTHDTYTKFVLSHTTTFRLVCGATILTPFIILYKCKLLPSSLLRILITKTAFKGVKVNTLTSRAKKYANEYLPTVMRNEMLEKIKAHQKNGDRVIIVSASLSPYLVHWSSNMGVELICSELEEKDGKFTGTYVNGDCSGKRKVVNIKKLVDLSSFENIIAYGDTKEDLEMLALANVKFYRGVMM